MSRVGGDSDLIVFITAISCRRTCNIESSAVDTVIGTCATDTTASRPIAKRNSRRWRRVRCRWDSGTRNCRSTAHGYYGRPTRCTEDQQRQRHTCGEEGDLSESARSADGDGIEASVVAGGG